MITISHPQGSPEWLAHRRTTRNASDAPAMMGASPYGTRSELVRQRATGVEREIDAATQRVFDRGHAVEPLLRAMAEQIIGEDLYPITATSDDGYLGASFDGVSLLEDTLLEAKQYNAAKVAHIGNGEIPPADYWQIVQQFAVCGPAERLLYLCGDGSEENTAKLWVTRGDVAHDIPKLRAAWAQFDADVAAYQPEAAQPEVIAAPVAGFGALSLRVEGRVLASNLDGFRADAEAFLARLPKASELETDQDFADADAAAKACAEAESRIKAALDAAIGQMADVDAVLRAGKAVAETIRAARLALEKALATEKEARRAKIVSQGVQSVRAHFDAINATLGEYRIAVAPSLAQEIGAAIKGKRSFTSIIDAVGAAAADAKIAASQHAERVRQNIAILAEYADWLHIIPDRVALAHTKQPDDLRNLVATRVAEYQRKISEDAQKEAERERIRAEEAARLEHEASGQAAKAQAAAENFEGITGASSAGVAQPVEHLPSKQAVAGSTPAARSTVKLGQINEAIGPLSITAEGLASLGFHPVGHERAAKLYDASQFPAMRKAMIALLESTELTMQQVAA